MGSILSTNGPSENTGTIQIPVLIPQEINPTRGSLGVMRTSSHAKGVRENGFTVSRHHGWSLVRLGCDCVVSVTSLGDPIGPTAEARRADR
jgi:hypothetical protein